MAIIQTKDKHGKEIYKYQQPEWKELYNKLEELLESFGKFIQAHDDLVLKDIAVNTPLLAEVLVRVDKRKDYFVIYHDDTEMNEIKEAALLAYWLIKFKPFSVKKPDLNIKYASINEHFALFVVYSAIKERTRRVSKMKFRVSKDYTHKISYALKYWDLSKESLMLISETLCEAMYTGKK